MIPCQLVAESSRFHPLLWISICSSRVSVSLGVDSGVSGVGVCSACNTSQSNCSSRSTGLRQQALVRKHVSWNTMLDVFCE